jgi:hypothetical protein
MKCTLHVATHAGMVSQSKIVDIIHTGRAPQLVSLDGEITELDAGTGQALLCDRT